MTTCTRAHALLFLQRSSFLNTVNLIIIGCNGIRNQMFLDTCIVQAERNVTIKKKQCKTSGENQEHRKWIDILKKELIGKD